MNNIFYTKNIKNKSYSFARVTRFLGKTYLMTHEQNDKLTSTVLFVFALFAPVTALALGVK